MKIKTLLISCAWPLFAGQANAESPQTVYDGSATTLPPAQGWTESKLDQSVNPVAAVTSADASTGVLRLQSTNAADQFSQLQWYQTGLGLDLAIGYTIEIKAKVTAAAKTGAFNLQGFDNHGKGFRIGILADKLTNLSNPLDATTTIASDLTNGDGFHVYRFAFAPSGVVNVYRDGTAVGTFPLSAFDFDNYIENGGFEDGDSHYFTSNSLLSTTTVPEEVYEGTKSFVINSDGKVQGTDPEAATTAPFPVKPNVEYDFSCNFRRLVLNGSWAWRDLGGYWDTQVGAIGGSNNPNVFWWNNPFENRGWNKRSQHITTPGDVRTIRFELPSWERDVNNKTSKVGFDNFVLRESMGFAPNQNPVSFTDPVIPEGITNLIFNGGFEDTTMNNDGQPFTWRLASESSSDSDNNPHSDNPMWGNNVRIQNQLKKDDFYDDNNLVSPDANWAHSGNNSLRFTSMDNNAKNIDFRVELDADKTYRFVFWHRNPRYNDWAWFFVRVGEQDPIWGHRMGDRANKWIPVDLTFTTTDENKTLHLYSTSTSHGGWYNQYFDDLVLYEVPSSNDPKTLSYVDPACAGKSNLIDNGDFENVAINNDGSSYTWALASNGENADVDFPMAYNDIWGTWLRIQDRNKRNDNEIYSDRDDTGYDYAHSGTKCVRFSFEDNWDAACDFQFGAGHREEALPSPYHLNINFVKELEANKTYTFVFYFKTSVWNDNNGSLYVANGDIKVLKQTISNKWMNWTRQSVTFSTTEADHTLRMYSDFTGWMNIYFDDLFLHEEDTYVPYSNADSYLAFGKSVGAGSTDVEVEYIKVDNTGAYAPANPVGIDAPALSKAALRVVGTSYFDITGRPAKKDAKGLLLQKSVYEDGTTGWSKAYIK
jgi:hypothetical protein